jgi:Ti-type conjugative transfer relaxase TraA
LQQSVGAEIGALMAIPFGHIDIIPADGDSNVVTLSAYVCRERRVDLVSGFTANFRHRLSDLFHAEFSLPDGTTHLFADGASLWNAALERERTIDRKTGERRFKRSAQVAKHVVLALPRELTNAQQIELVRAFVQAQFVRHGVAAEWAIHIDAQGSNPHAHILLTTRQLTSEGFGRKARDLNPNFATNKRKKTRFVSEQDAISDRWAQAQNEFFLVNGLDVTVDPKRVVDDVHRGPTWHIQDAELEAQSRAARKQAIAAMNDPARVLEGMTTRLSSFTRRDLERFIKKHGLLGDDCKKAVDAALAHSSVLRIWDPTRPDAAARYTTATVRDQETAILRLADKLQRCGSNLPPELVNEAACRFTLDPEQREALAYACQPGLSLLIGRAGTGKSRTVAGIASAFRHAGSYKIYGLGPTNAAAINLRSEGFEFSSTIHRALWEVQNGKQIWNEKTVLIVDEAGLVDSVTLHSLMQEAAKTGSKLILAGDDRQLLSVARGGMFGYLSTRFETRTIATVRRQYADWQRQASRLLADGDIGAAVRMYSERGHVHWAANCDENIGRLLEAWAREEGSGDLRFIYASTNAAVDRLNAEAQKIRLAKGELSSPAPFVTARGPTQLCIGDRIQFHQNDRATGITNGLFGEVHSIRGSWLVVVTDVGSVIEFDTANFTGWSLGYAGTLYKGQGQTRLSVYALHDSAFAWEARSSYVALTRHRASVQLYVSRDLVSDENDLVRQMSRKTENLPSIAYAIAPPPASVVQRKIELLNPSPSLTARTLGHSGPKKRRWFAPTKKVTP